MGQKSTRKRELRGRPAPEYKTVKKPPLPSEDSEQAAVSRFLSKIGAFHCHVPNGGTRGRVEAARFRRMGVKAGIPDLLIFDVPEGAGFAGVALEMKRRRGGQGRPAAVTAAQRKAIAQFDQCGWETHVAYGAQDAIEFLNELGYDAESVFERH